MSKPMSVCCNADVWLTSPEWVYRTVLSVVVDEHGEFRADDFGEIEKTVDMEHMDNEYECSACGNTITMSEVATS